MHRMMQQGKEINWLLKHHRIESINQMNIEFLTSMTAMNHCEPSWMGKSYLVGDKSWQTSGKEIETTSSVSSAKTTLIKKLLSKHCQNVWIFCVHHQQKSKFEAAIAIETKTFSCQFIDNQIASKNSNVDRHISPALFVELSSNWKQKPEIKSSSCLTICGHR